MVDLSIATLNYQRVNLPIKSIRNLICSPFLSIKWCPSASLDQWPWDILGSNFEENIGKSSTFGVLSLPLSGHKLLYHVVIKTLRSSSWLPISSPVRTATAWFSIDKDPSFCSYTPSLPEDLSNYWCVLRRVAGWVAGGYWDDDW